MSMRRDTVAVVGTGGERLGSSCVHCRHVDDQPERGTTLAPRLDPAVFGLAGDRRRPVRRHERVGFRRELEILVDRGISVVDVVVEHPLYGEVAANLLVQARSDIDRYIEALDREDAQPLSALTGGVHLHHVRVPNLDALEAARRELAAEGILLADD